MGCGTAIYMRTDLELEQGGSLDQKRPFLGLYRVANRYLTTFVTPSGEVTESAVSTHHYINAFRIVDAMSPLLPLEQFVLLTSPKHQRYKELQKQTNVETLGMPIWDAEELHQLWEFQYKSVITESEWKDRFNKWGGIPRSVLSKGSVTYQQALDDNCSNLDLNTCLKSVGLQKYDSNSVSGTVLHLTVTDMRLESNI